MNYYVNKNGRQYGPMTEDRILTGLGNGQLLRTDLGIKHGGSEWRELGSIFQTIPKTVSPGVPVEGPQHVLTSGNVEEWARVTFQLPLFITLRNDSLAGRIKVILFYYSVPLFSLASGGVFYLLGNDVSIGLFLIAGLLFPILTFIGIPILLFGYFKKRNMVSSFDNKGISVRNGTHFLWDQLKYVDKKSFNTRGFNPIQKIIFAIIFRGTDSETLTFAFDGGKAVLPPLIVNSREVHAKFQTIPADIKS